jgi:hypothetical protein
MKTITAIILLTFTVLSFTGSAFASDNSSCDTEVQVNSDLSINIPFLVLNAGHYWARLNFAGENEQGEATWTLNEYGVLENCFDYFRAGTVRADSDLELRINEANFTNEAGASETISFFLAYDGSNEESDLIWHRVEESEVFEEDNESQAFSFDGWSAENPTFNSDAFTINQEALDAINLSIREAFANNVAPNFPDLSGLSGSSNLAQTLINSLLASLNF